MVDSSDLLRLAGIIDEQGNAQPEPMFEDIDATDHAAMTVPPAARPRGAAKKAPDSPVVVIQKQPPEPLADGMSDGERAPPGSSDDDSEDSSEDSDEDSDSTTTRSSSRVRRRRGRRRGRRLRAHGRVLRRRRGRVRRRGARECEIHQIEDCFDANGKVKAAVRLLAKAVSAQAGKTPLSPVFAKSAVVGNVTDWDTKARPGSRSKSWQGGPNQNGVPMKNLKSPAPQRRLLATRAIEECVEQTLAAVGADGGLAEAPTSFGKNSKTCARVTLIEPTAAVMFRCDELEMDNVVDPELHEAQGLVGARRRRTASTRATARLMLLAKLIAETDRTSEGTLLLDVQERDGR
ncbi:hypothetical protein JL720_9602 [Aureococcus anophagefferens]|nr:hypothetical protein JL720_9602 [Aureococcus anophagefferens]